MGAISECQCPIVREGCIYAKWLLGLRPALVFKRKDLWSKARSAVSRSCFRLRRI